MEKEWFRTWFNSSYYHLLHAGHNPAGAYAFIDRLLAYLQPHPGAALLDAACSTGRYAHYLAGKGLDVTGIDLSPDAIEAAKETETTNLHFFEQDLRLPYAANLFAYCFHLFAPLGYYRTQRENENALRTMVQALQPGGKLVLDYLNATPAAQPLPSPKELQMEDVSFRISRWQDDAFSYKQTDVLNTGESYTEQFRKYSLENSKNMLEKQGMQVVAVFGDYELHSFEEAQSQRMIIIAERAINQASN